MASALRSLTQQQTRLPLPIGGLDYRVSLLDASPASALLLDNFIARPYGIEMRKGWRYWVPAASSFANEVRTIICYTSQVTADSRVFAATADAAGKIYNVTTQNAAGVLSLTPSTAPTTLGEWYSANYSTPGGSFLCIVAAGAGYYTYDGSAWTERVVGAGAGQIQFPGGDTTTIKELAFCWIWKNRLWFLKKNSSRAYYLPVSSISGALTAFELGSQLIHGGPLSFATNWTYDSGRGIDDGLVFASEEGDILVYQGTDPASASTFSQQGAWYVGRFPMGRRGFAPQGGDILFVTEYGLIKLSDLVSGRIQTAGLGGGPDSIYKINPRLSRFISRDLSLKYWFLLHCPSETLLLLGSPYVSELTGLRQSFVSNAITGAWSSISDVDILCGDIHEGSIIVGTRAGEVIQLFYEYGDKASSDGLDSGSSVTGRFQTSFQDYGANTMNKRMLRIKLYGITDAIPTVSAKFVPEYELNTIPSVSSSSGTGAAKWDLASWDAAIWGGSQLPLRKWMGVSGYGKSLSLVAAIRVQGYLLLSDYESLFEVGNNL